MKIAAVIVTYNRFELLKECVESLRNQTRKLDEIIVINNSNTKGNLEWLESQDDLTVISQVNSGSAGGQYTGIQTAYTKGHDWIWCMDDDAEPNINTLEGIIKYAKDDISAVCPDVYNTEGARLVLHRGNVNLQEVKSFVLQTSIENYMLNKEVLKIDFASFVGILINRKAVRKIGLPNKYFFIHHDDVEYSLRLKEFGNILLVPKQIIIHKEVSSKHLIKRKFLWKTSYRYKYENYCINYFTFRNHFWLLNRYLKSKRLVLCSIINDLQRESRRILLYDDYKIKRLSLLFKAFLDAMNNKLDVNLIEIKQHLYGKYQKEK